MAKTVLTYTYTSVLAVTIDEEAPPAACTQTSMTHDLRWTQEGAPQDANATYMVQLMQEKQLEYREHPLSYFALLYWIGAPDNETLNNLLGTLLQLRQSWRATAVKPTARRWHKWLEYFKIG